VGKTTLARQFARQRKSPLTYFDLESPVDRARLDEPMLTLEPLRGLVILDEIHRRPELFPILRVLADRPRQLARFLVLGSAAPGLLRQTSESLAGRIAYHVLTGFSFDETGPQKLPRLWLRGGFPRSFLAPSEAASQAWRRDFIETFLQRDLPELGLNIPSETLRRFWSMLAHYHAQVWSGSEFARSFAVSDPTVRRYLDLLVSTFLIRILLPWHENLRKRQVKSPKIFFADSGLLHSMLGIGTLEDLEQHPRLGASWEGFAMFEVVRRLGARPEECYFWATHTGAELDLLVVRGRKRWGFEFKRTDAPGVTPSMRTALTDLGLDSIDVIHAGSETYPLHRKMRAVSLERLLVDVKPLP
jgi:predicted AAA+ superfamily ATPase